MPALVGMATQIWMSCISAVYIRHDARRDVPAVIAAATNEANGSILSDTMAII